MRVCIDIQSAVTQRAGVGRYTRLLVQNLVAGLGDDELRLISFDFRRRGLPFTVAGARLKTVHWCPGRLAQLGWKSINWPPYDLFSGAADVYHFPNFTLPPLRRGRSVVTIHDVTFARFPQFTEERNRRYLNARMAETLRKADAIITVSEFSAGEISLLLRVHRDRVYSIHHGIGAEFVPQPVTAVSTMRRRLNLDRPYLLHVGTVEPRKNIPLLIDLFDRLEDFDGDLVLAGMPGWKYEPILERIQRSPRVSRIRWLRYVDDALLPALYTGAELFLFPSFYEGFGFPPLEAMACGTAVISSTGGSLPEVLGTAPVMLDTHDPEQWAEAVRALLGSHERRQTVAQAGRERAARFSWAETARRTWDIYRMLGR